MIPPNRPPSCDRATTAPQSPRGGEASSASPHARPPPSQPNPQRTYLQSLPTTKTRPTQTRCATEPAHCAPDRQAQKQAASMPISPTAVTRQPRALLPETPQTRRPTTQPPDSHRKHRDNQFTQETNASSPQKVVVPNQPPDARMPTRCSTATQGQTYLQRATQQTPQRTTRNPRRTAAQPKQVTPAKQKPSCTKPLSRLSCPIALKSKRTPPQIAPQSCA